MGLDGPELSTQTRLSDGCRGRTKVMAFARRVAG
jgi:hypothetical protein